jgi:oligoribonuclease NrnB/cAMP/cGMP phosphodiesterase (DHH superfamily)
MPEAHEAPSPLSSKPPSTGSGIVARMRRICFYHAGCPDGFGAAWAARRAWGDKARYVPRGHEDEIDAADHTGDRVVYADITPANKELSALAEVAEQITILDHHVSSQQRIEAEPQLVESSEELGHELLFDLGHSGAILTWRYFHPELPAPDLLRYVEDQDLWNWKLPRSEEVNAAIASYPRRFDIWDELAERPVEELVREGEPILRSNEMEVTRALKSASLIRVDGQQVEAVNATVNRARIGHELAQRARYGVAWGCVYRVVGDRVHATLYSIGDVDVSLVAAGFGGGGHRNASGLAVDLAVWLRDFV